MQARFWEIDALRGVAIIMMVIFHFLWDLNFFTDTEIVLTQGFWEVFRIITASAFLFLVGISLYLSSYGRDFVFRKLLKRGLYIFFLGLLLTLFSRFAFPESYIIFGVLHLIGVSIILSPVFLRLKYSNLFLGFVFVFLGVVLENYRFDLTFLFFLGFAPANLTTLDYYPLLPWFGVVVWGIFAAKVLYAGRVRRFSLPWQENNFFTDKLSFLGRHSLIIYFLHQPILFLLFYIFTEFIPFN